MQAAIDKIDADTEARIEECRRHGEHRKRMLALGLKNWREYVADTWSKAREKKTRFQAALICDAPDNNLTVPWRDRDPDIAIVVDEFVDARRREGIEVNIYVKQSKWEPVERYWERGEKIIMTCDV